MTVLVSTQDRITTVTINRPDVRNAVDGPTARALEQAFLAFDQDDAADVAILTGASGSFCAGADLKAVAQGVVTDTATAGIDPAKSSASTLASRANPLQSDMSAAAPMGCTRLLLSKPVIAAISGHAVAGGLELALWCDLRVIDQTAVFGVFCRRWGVPLIDGGTVRLPRLIGMSRALDMILTGRPVLADEAMHMGLAHRLAPSGQALEYAVTLAKTLSAFPQTCLRSDRLSALQQAGMPERDALQQEFERGLQVIHSGETVAGAGRFAAGAGRHGAFAELAKKST